MHISKIGLNTNKRARVNFTAQDSTATKPVSLSTDSTITKNINAFITNISIKSTENTMIDLKDIESYNLPNGIRIDFDTRWSNKETYARILLTPTKEIDAKPGTYELLGHMLGEAPSKFSDRVRDNDKNELPLYASADITNKHLRATINCDHTRTTEGIDKMLGYMFDPSFTEEGVHDAKEKLRKDIDFYCSSITYQVENELKNGSLEEKRKNLDSITLQDVQTLYANILSNSEGKVVVSLPKAVYAKQRNNLLTAFSTKMPELKQHTGQEYIKTIHPIEKSLIYKGKSHDDKTRYNKYFVIQSDNSVKNNVLSPLLGRALENALKSTLADGNSTVRSDYYNLDGNKFMYFSIETSKSDKQKSNPDFENAFKAAIERLTQVPISENELSLIKKEEKEFMLRARDEQSGRTEELVSNRPGGNNYLNEYVKEIDKTTAADIQQAAQKYLTQPSITAIGED